MTQSLPSADFNFLLTQTHLILSSYTHWTGKQLIPENQKEEALVRGLFFAPFIVASTGTEADPVLNYGNQTALDLWELDWKTFTKTPGRHTAEAMEREARARFLERVKTNGYVDDYQGIRISSTGRRFEISQATVWNLIDSKKQFAGQAVTFKNPRYLPA